MAYKEGEFACKICGCKFVSKRKAPNTCSKSCRMKLMGKQLKSEKKTLGICEQCGNEFEYVPNKRHPIYRFCSQDCRYKARVKFLKENGNSEETKKKISDKLKGRSLIDRGFSEESIRNSITALKKAGKKHNDNMRGKTYEKIYGEERGKEIKEKFSENRTGDNNSQSLISISKRKNCSLEEAKKYTTCYGRRKEKHPLFNKHHTIEAKTKIVRTLEASENKFFNVAHGTFNKIVWQGSWELQFLIECFSKNIKVKRYDMKPIEYVGENNNIRHYFPDYIVGEDLIVEIKNPNQLKETNTKRKIEAAKKAFKEKYLVISSGFINETSRKLWYKQMQEKYGDILIIKHNPHEAEVEN